MEGGNQLAIYKRCQGFEVRTTENKSSKWLERDSNPRPPDCESDALNTRPRCLLFLYWSSQNNTSGALTICTEISVKNFRQMVLVSFLAAPKTGTGLSCTIYKIPVNFSLSLDMKPGTGNPNIWYISFR